MVPLKERCYSFSLKMIKFLKGREWDKLNMVLVYQLMRSATSVGANVSEASGSSTRREYKRYFEISLKSSNESLYWLNLLKDSNEWEQQEQVNELIIECTALSKMLTAAVKKLKENKKD